MKIFTTREDWLHAAREMMSVYFAKIDAPLHKKIRVSCGFPPRGFERIAGQCHTQAASKDGVNEIFVSPMQDDPATVLGILTHELIHAQDDCDSGHGAPFVAKALALGLEGKPTHAGSGESFKRIYGAELRLLGDYPHANLQVSKIKKQGTRMLKCECAECGYTVRTTAKWIEAAGAPLCPGVDCDGAVMAIAP